MARIHLFARLKQVAATAGKAPRAKDGGWTGNTVRNVPNFKLAKHMQFQEVQRQFGFFEKLYFVLQLWLQKSPNVNPPPCVC
jgi:hypothetical protein